MGDYVVKFLHAEVLRLADKALQTIGFMNATVYRHRKYAVLLMPDIDRKVAQPGRCCPYLDVSGTGVRSTTLTGKDAPLRSSDLTGS